MLCLIALFLEGGMIFIMWGTGSVIPAGMRKLVLVLAMGGIIGVTPLKIQFLNLVFKKPASKAGIIILIVLFIGIGALFFSIDGMVAQAEIKKAEKVFKVFLADPIPEGVLLHEGSFTGFQGGGGYIFFDAAPEVWQPLVTTYQKLPLKIVDIYRMPKRIRTMKDPIVYYRYDQGGCFYFVADGESQSVYYTVSVGLGDSYSQEAGLFHPSIET